MLGACWLRPCARTHRKKGLVPHLPVRWGAQQIPQSRSVWHGSDRVCVGTWRFPSASGGLPLRLLLPSGKLGLSPEPPDRAVGIFGKCWARPCARTHLKWPWATLARSVGRGTNTPVQISLIPVYDQSTSLKSRFLLLKYILTLSLILCSYYEQPLSCKYLFL